MSSLTASGFVKPVAIWDAAFVTDPGKVRSQNQDAFIALPEHGLWAVADGVGGHNGGERASQLTIDSIRNHPSCDELSVSIDHVISSIRSANEELRSIAVQEYDSETVATTVAALVASGEEAAVVWVGDSRIYRLRNGALQPLTRDHTVAAEFQDSDGPHVATGPAAALTRAVGAAETIDVEQRIWDVQSGDVFILCTDGLYKELTVDEMADGAALAANSAEAANRLMELALSRRARDNITVGVVRCLGYL